MSLTEKTVPEKTVPEKTVPEEIVPEKMDPEKTAPEPMDPETVGPPAKSQDVERFNRKDAEEGFFSGAAGPWVALAATISLLIVLFAVAFGGGVGAPRSFENDAYSRSAIGHRAFVDWLRREPGIEVLVSRHRSEQRVGAGQALVLLEPDLAHAPDVELAEVVASALAAGAHVLVVLPKWRGVEGDRPGWVESVDLIGTGQVAEVLNTALAAAGASPDGTDPALSVRRGPPPELWQGLPNVEIELPLTQRMEPVGTAGLRSVWRDEASSLLVAAGAESKLWILSDPDLLNTAGLARAENASALMHLLTGLMGVDAVVVDETLHGYWRRPSPWAALLAMPLLPMTLHALLLLAGLLWAANRRFGAPLPAPVRLDAGKRTLIENTAALLSMTSHRRQALQAYFELTLRRTAAALGVRAQPHERVRRLDRLAELRGVELRIEPLARSLEHLPKTPDGRRVVQLARSMHAFRRALTMKTGVDS